jgi:hypothetical protein
MEAYYANVIDVTMLRREQERIGAGLRAIESRQAILDDWQEVMDLALRFSTRCPPPTGVEVTGRGGCSTRPCSTTLRVRDGHVVEAAYKEPFDILFSVQKFEYDDVVEGR